MFFAVWPVKQKYGRSLSWADLFMLTGNQALDIMGLETYGFGGGRRDIFASEDDVYWGPEPEMLTDERHEGVGDIDDPLGASEMGLSEWSENILKLLSFMCSSSYTHNLTLIIKQST